MKVTELQEALSLAGSLRAKILNIETALKDLTKPGTKINRHGTDIYFVSGTINVGRLMGVDEETVNVYVNSEVGELIKDDFKAILEKHLELLKSELEALEVK